MAPSAEAACVASGVAIRQPQSTRPGRHRPWRQAKLACGAAAEGGAEEEEERLGAYLFVAGVVGLAVEDYADDSDFDDSDEVVSFSDTELVLDCMDSEEEEQEQEEAEGLVDMPWAVVAPGSPFDFRSLVVSLLDGALGGAASGFGPIDVEDPAEPAEEILPAASELVPCTRPAFKRLAPPRQLTPGAEPFPTDCLLSAPVASAAPTTPWNLAALARSLLSAEETAEEPAEATASAPSVMVPVPPQGERTVHRPRPHPGSLVAEGRERAAEVDMDSDKEDEEAKGLVEMPWATVAPSGPFDFRSLVVSLLDGALGGAASGFGPIDVEEPAEESLPAASELAPCTRPALKRLAPPRQLTPGAQPFPMDCLLSAPVASAAPATPSNLAALARSLLLSAEESAEETAEEPAEAPASAPSVMVPVPPQGERTAHRPRPHRSLVAEGRERAVGACVPVAPGTPRAVPVVPCTPRMVATSPRGRPQAARPAAAAAPGALKPVKLPAKMAAGFTVRIASPSPDGPPGGAGRASSLAGRFKALGVVQFHSLDDGSSAAPPAAPRTMSAMEMDLGDGPAALGFQGPPPFAPPSSAQTRLAHHGGVLSKAQGLLPNLVAQYFPAWRIPETVGTPREQSWRAC